MAGKSDERPDSGDKDSGDENEKDEELVDAIKDLLKNDAETDDLIDAIREEIESAAEEDAETNDRWMPSPEAVARDKWLTPPEFRADEYIQTRKQVDKQIRVLKTKLVNLLSSRSRSRKVCDKKSGKLDQSALHKLTTGSKRVFAQVLPGIELNTAVSILVDESGSMGITDHLGSPSYWSKRTVIALAETLEALNIPFEVIGFHNLRKYGSPFRNGVDGKLWSRLSAFRMRVFKSFGEQHKRVKSRLLGITGLEENVDPEALLMTAQRLAARPEPRRILLVLSDGEPAGPCDMDRVDAELGRTVKQITDAGLECYGIGFGRNAKGARAVEKFYNAANGSDSIVIPPGEIDQLAVRVFKLLRDKLLRQ